MSTTTDRPAAGWAWLAALPDTLAAQRRVMSGLLEFSERAPMVDSLVVGCSLGRGAADSLSDVDGALGVRAPVGEPGAEVVRTVEEDVVNALPSLGEVVDVLRQRYGPRDEFILRVFAQFADGPQLDLALVAASRLRRGRAAPDYVSLYEAGDEPAPGPATDAYAVSAQQVHEWAFLGWCALVDAHKYLRRGSLWEAHNRLHETRHNIWALWAAATGAMYPQHGLSQVLDRDPEDLPSGVERTVADLDFGRLVRAAQAAGTVLTQVSREAASRIGASLPEAMAGYVTARLAELATSPA